MSKGVLLDVRNLTKYFPVRRGILRRPSGRLRAVDDISFTIGSGETFGLVGESGCGKTTTGRAILRLIEPDGGQIRFDGVDLLGLTPSELRHRRREIQIIFQDPYASLNPRMKVERIVGEPLIIHRMASGKALERRVANLLESVGLDTGAGNRFPHEFSGGQRQRIGIARALALNPKLIVADEPVSALDVSIQAQIVNLLGDLQKERGLAYLFISHSIPMVEHVSRRIGVMYLGKLVEVGPSTDISRNPKHPYTKALLSAVPATTPGRRRERTILGGDVPTPVDPPAGCRFHPRCPVVVDRCRTEEPPLRRLGDERWGACHLAE
jgi:oligopeptide transport system ATP-binding protein